MKDRELYDLLEAYYREGEFNSLLIKPKAWFSENGCRCPITHVLISEGLLSEQALLDSIRRNGNQFTECIAPIISFNGAHGEFTSAFDKNENVESALKIYKQYIDILEGKDGQEI